MRGEASWLEQQPYYQRALAGDTVHFSRLVDGVVNGPRWMRTSYVPDFDEAGCVVGVYTTTTDVHDLTVTLEKLRRSVERDALTDALGQLVEDTARRAQMGAAAKAGADRLTWRGAAREALAALGDAAR